VHENRFQEVLVKFCWDAEYSEMFWGPTVSDVCACSMSFLNVRGFRFFCGPFVLMEFSQ
jgi:hypothetical protein